MKKNFYNSKDESYEHVKNLLNELPKVKAPDNFEYNLNVRIQNKNFGSKSEKKIGFSPWKIFVPATGAIMASIVLLLFLTNNNSDVLENPFQIIPKLRSEMSGSLANSNIFSQKFGKQEKISDTDVVIDKSDDEFNSDENLVIADSKPANVNNSPKEFPFDNYKTTNIDKVLNSRNNESSITSKTKLAGRGTSQNYFNGFFLGEEVDKEYVEALKTRLDSVKKSILKKKYSKIAQ